MIVTADPHLAAKCRRIREYGWKTKFISEEAGINSRLDEMHAAILRVKLPHVDRWNHLRQNHAQYYDRELADLPVTLPTTEPKSTHAYHQYVLKCDERDGLREFLAKEGIGTAIHYPVPVHRQPAYKMLRGVLPHTEAVAKTILSLPMFPELQPDALQTIVQSMKRFFYGTRKHSAVRGAGAHRQTAHSLE